MGFGMNQSDEWDRENKALRERLSEASLCINESLDYDTVLRGGLDSACALTDARYGVITLLDDAGRVSRPLRPGTRRRLLRLGSAARKTKPATPPTSLLSRGWATGCRGLGGRKRRWHDRSRPAPCCWHKLPSRIPA